MSTRSRSSLPCAFAGLVFALAAATITPHAAAQEGVPPPPGLVPEQMWYAPTAADWQKPVLIRWQRTWDDAVRLSQETKRPILVCVNMDGEIASEHYAGVRYRDPEIAKLFEPYVCVIASVYRHNERDYDEQGHRIPCPRFGGVTCAEHMAIEPIVYEKFLDGKRISPRHIMVELDGSETYDVFYTWDTASVFTALRDGIEKRSIQAPPIVKGDRSLRERIESPDSSDREQIESMYATADAEQRRALLQTALETGEHVPVELLRLAAYGLDTDLATKARQGMQVAVDPGTVELIAETMRMPLEATERQQLTAALRRFGATSTRARTLATAHSGLAQPSQVIDTKRWSAAMAGASYAAAVPKSDLATLAARQDEALAARPDSADARLDVAETSLLQALATEAGNGRGAKRQAEQTRELLFMDADREASEAIHRGASGWRAEAVRAVAAFHLGRTAEAYELAIAAAPGLPPEAPGRLAVELLALFAEARQEAIVAAVRSKQEWPPSWTTDVHASYAVLGKHPLGRDVHVARHYDFLQFFGTPEAAAVLERGLQRFPDSALLHARLRQNVLTQQGPDALEAEYARRAKLADAPATLPWFAGYASLVAAEAHRKKHEGDAAIAAYERGRAAFERYREATGNTDGAHYVAMAHAGIARVHLQAGALGAALADLQQAFQAAPLAAAAVDGLGITAVQTAEMLRQRAAEVKDDDVVQKLDAALALLPPEALVPPEYERNSRPARGRGRRGG
ncbi:MAG TPA: hypothetical protein VFZ65_13390 [Planctomycetota bacterium]|nr:hypothetical protein [Planctomycetota bacterium]